MAGVAECVACMAIRVRAEAAFCGTRPHASFQITPDSCAQRNRVVRLPTPQNPATR
jgi:hypothetical protein